MSGYGNLAGTNLDTSSTEGRPLSLRSKLSDLRARLRTLAARTESLADLFDGTVPKSVEATMGGGGAGGVGPGLYTELFLLIEGCHTELDIIENSMLRIAR